MVDYVTSIAAGLGDDDTGTNSPYDATVYCPPFCEGHLGYPNLYYGSYTEYNWEEEKSYFGQFDYNVNDKLTLTYGIRDYEISDASKTYQYGIFYMDEGMETVMVTHRSKLLVHNVLSYQDQNLIQGRNLLSAIN